MTNGSIHNPVQGAADALLRLGETRPELAAVLSRFIAAVADEAGRTARFANSLESALSPSGESTIKPRRTGRRAPGIIDPFAVYAETAETGLRDRLRELDLEQLRDIVAEHGMDHDRLAMKWKDPARVIDRIVDKVSSRASKGSAFRPEQS